MFPRPPNWAIMRHGLDSTTIGLGSCTHELTVICVPDDPRNIWTVLELSYYSSRITPGHYEGDLTSFEQPILLSQTVQYLPGAGCYAAMVFY